MSQSDEIHRLRPLATITEMAYEAELMELRVIGHREQKLRQSLADLDVRAQDGFLRSLAGGDVPVSFASGQDRAWRDWLSTRRNSLQRELAGVLAEKSEHMIKLTRTLGRKDVAAKMLTARAFEDRQNHQRKTMAALQELSLLVRSHSRH